VGVLALSEKETAQLAAQIILPFLLDTRMTLWRIMAAKNLAQFGGFYDSTNLFRMRLSHNPRAGDLPTSKGNAQHARAIGGDASSSRTNNVPQESLA
jgi:hypothetical protein